MVGIGCLFCKNNKLSANYKEKSGKPLVVILLILLHTFHLPCPNYKRNGLYKDITGAQAHGLRSTLLEMRNYSGLVVNRRMAYQGLKALRIIQLSPTFVSPSAPKP